MKITMRPLFDGGIISVFIKHWCKNDRTIYADIPTPKAMVRTPGSCLPIRVMLRADTYPHARAFKGSGVNYHRIIVATDWMPRNRSGPSRFSAYTPARWIISYRSSTAIGFHPPVHAGHRRLPGKERAPWDTVSRRMTMQWYFWIRFTPRNAP